MWSLAVNTEQTCAVVGSVAKEVQVFRIDSPDATLQTGHAKPATMVDAANMSDSQPQVLMLQGTLEHDTTNRIACIAFSSDGTFLAACSTGAPHPVLPPAACVCASTDRVAFVPLTVSFTFAPFAAGNKVQIWRKRSAKEVQRKLKRRRKRVEAKDQDGGAMEVALQPSDEWEAFAVHRAAAAVRSFAFIPGSTPRATLCRLGVILADNSVTMLRVREVRPTWHAKHPWNIWTTLREPRRCQQRWVWRLHCACAHEPCAEELRRVPHSYLQCQLTEHLTWRSMWLYRDVMIHAHACRRLPAHAAMRTHVLPHCQWQDRRQEVRCEVWRRAG